MQWNPDCKGEPCECPGTEVGTPPPPEDTPIPTTAEGRRAEVRNRHSETCLICARYIEQGDESDRPTPLER